MRWYYLWQLRRANVKLSEALEDLPEGWSENPEEHVHELVEWALAHCRVSDLVTKLDSYKKV